MGISGALRSVALDTSSRTGVRLSVLASLVAVLLGICCGCKSPDVTTLRSRVAAGEGDVVVAVAWPWEMDTGLLYAEGLELAIDEVNAQGGIHGRRLRMLKVDDGGSVNEGRRVAQEVGENPEVMAVIGHLYSHVTVPSAAIYDLAGLVLLAPTSTDSELTGMGYSRVFRLPGTDAVLGKRAAEYVLTQGYERVAVYYVRNSPGRDLANGFEEELSAAGASVVARGSYDSAHLPSEGTLRDLLETWTSLDVDALFLAGEVPSAGRLIAQLRKLGFRNPVIGGDALFSPALIEFGGPAVDGTVVATYFHPDEPREEVEEFVASFRGRMGMAPDASAAFAYDAVKLLADALREAPTPAPADVAAFLREVKGWRGVTGSLTFDEKGDPVRRRISVAVVRDGEFMYLEGL